MHFDHRVRLHAAGQQPFDLDEWEGVLSFLRNAPWVLVVEDVEDATPQNYAQSAQQRLRILEARLGVRCIVFGWCDGPFAKRGEPRAVALRQARASALALARIIAAITLTPEGVQRPSVLVDGLGAMVLENVVTQNLWIGRRAFNTVVITQPDCSAVEHAKWLEPFGLIEQVYVLWHGQDEVLEEIARDQSAALEPLGLGTVCPLAASVDYIDCGASGAVVPRLRTVFMDDQAHKDSPIVEFLVEALSGISPLKRERAKIRRTRRAKVWQLTSAGPGS